MQFVVKPKFHKFSYVKTDKTRRFRNEDVRLGKRQHNLIFSNNTLNNPKYKYRIITIPLESGTYQFKIQSIDDLENINAGVSTSAVMADKLWYPRNFTITGISGNDVTFTWNAPLGGLSVDNYIIYGNGGAGYVIDRGTSLATVSGATFQTTINSLANGDWFFVVESEASSVETVNYFTLIATLPIEDTVPTVPNEPEDPPSNPMNAEFQLQNINFKNITVGKCGIEFIWTYGDQASHFQIFHDSGTGTIDWGTYKFRYARQNKIVQSFTTDQIVSVEGNFDYKFGIRAESSDAVLDTNTIEYTVVLDGEAPNEVTDVTAGEI